MNFLRKIFKSKGKGEPIKSYSDFWKWFEQNERNFYGIVKERGNIQDGFLNKLSPKLSQLNEGFWFLTGMYDDDTVELILTPDGVVKNIVFVEELVASAPKLEGWRFTALKPESEIESSCINMGNYVFDDKSLSFYANNYKEYPDEIDITIVHRDFNESDKDQIANGTFIFLDNFLGELNSVTNIDNVKIIGVNDAEKELVPISKLPSFLIWRQKEFIEKYEGVRYNTENDTHSSLEATLKNGKPLLAIVNSTLLEWDSKASHPWFLVVEIKYDVENDSGIPTQEAYELLNEFEDKALELLKDADGYLNLGRQTVDGEREIFFACKDFREPSKVFNNLIKEYNNRLQINYDIFKDKYWRRMNWFRQSS